MSEKSEGSGMEELVHEAAAGSEKALSELLISFHPLIKKSAADFSGADGFLYDDLFQEGMVALCRAVVRYDSARGAFPAFVRRCVRNAMISVVRKCPREILVEEFDDKDFSEWGAGGYRGVEIRDDLRSLLEELTPLETAVLDAYLQTGGVGAAIRVLGWPRKRVENALARIRKKYQVLRPADGDDAKITGQGGGPALT